MSFYLSKHDTSALKGIAIFAMLMHHLWGCPPSWVEPYTGVLGFLGFVGKVCVAMFLFCSGYGLSVGYQKVLNNTQITMHNWKYGLVVTLKFLAKRFLKFYAGYWPIFVIFVPLGVLVFGRGLYDAYGSDSNVFKCLLYDTFGIGGWSSYNITWWFNKLIIIMYLLFPLLYAFISRRPIISMCIIIIMMRLSSHFTFDYMSNVLDYSFPFALGILYSKYQGKVKPISIWIENHLSFSVIVSFLCLALALLLRVKGYIPHFSGGIRWDGVLTLSIVVFYCCIRTYIPKTIEIIAIGGKHSANIYLTHTFFFFYWFPNLYYSCELGWGNIILLLTICIIVSIIIEWTKEKTKWNKLSNILIERVNNI